MTTEMPGWFAELDLKLDGEERVLEEAATSVARITEDEDSWHGNKLKAMLATALQRSDMEELRRGEMFANLHARISLVAATTTVKCPFSETHCPRTRWASRAEGAGACGSMHRGAHGEA